MPSEAKRHHYIPQFILRNFCFDQKHLYYYDSKIVVKEPKDVFMGRDLYRDEKDHPDDPTAIEKTLGKFECEMAGIINNRLLTHREAVLSAWEDEKLKLFFALMGFRASNTARRFETRDDLQRWKRNLDRIAQSRCLEEVLNHPDVDGDIKLFMHRDINGYLGRYFALVEANEGNSFVISDCYPVVITGTLQNGIPLEMYDIYPISPKRVLLLACRGVENAPDQVLQLRKHLLLPPKGVAGTNHIKLRTKTLCADEVAYINRCIIKNATQGVVLPEQMEMPGL